MSVLATSDPAGVDDGRAARFDELFRVEYPGMVRLAYALVRDGAEAEDLVQDSFVEVYQRLDDVRRPGAYLRTTVANRCRNALTRRRVAELHRPDPPPELSESAVEFWDVLARLPDDQRVAVVLKYYGRFRASEIARIVDQPASTVRTHVRRGLATLRRELES